MREEGRRRQHRVDEHEAVEERGIRGRRHHQRGAAEGMPDTEQARAAELRRELTRYRAGVLAEARPRVVLGIRGIGLRRLAVSARVEGDEVEARA